MADDSVDEQTRARKAARQAIQKRYYETHRAAQIAKAKARNLLIRDDRNAARRAYRKEHPDEALARDALERAKYQVKIAERARARRAADPEKFKKINKKWALANPDNVRLHERKQRAKRLAAEGAHTHADIVAIREAQKDKCAMSFCRVKLKGKGHIDHIQPLSKGGSNWPRNLQLLCVACNQSKKARDPIDFAQSRGLLI